MPKHYIAGLFFFLFTTLAYSQEFTIRGSVTDSLTGEPLEAATVFLERAADSSLVTYTITDRQGSFALEGRLAQPRAWLNISFNGYTRYRKAVRLQPQLDVGAVALAPAVQTLDQVELVGERVPVEIRKDTVEFNANSFRTRADATVEELLRKLPGVEIANDGTVTVNGKEVNQILVNGQVFFSKDAQVVTKSLPKAIIDKIQVTNTKTKVEEFTGQEGQGDTKTINLTLKKDKNKGVIGRLSAGYGTDSRYQANGLLNYFKDQMRTSVIASANNINNTGFSFDEIYGMLGRIRGGVSFNSGGAFRIGNASFGFGQGIITSSNLGASYADARKGAYETNANYFFAYSDSYNDETIRRENFLPDGRFITDTETSFDGTTRSHRGSANLEFDFGKNLRITSEPSISISDTESLQSQGVVSADEAGNRVNALQNRTTANGASQDFTHRLEAIQKIDTAGRLFRIAVENRIGRNQDLRLLESEQTLYPGGVAQTERFDQRTDISALQETHEVLGNYRETLGRQWFLDLTYTYRNDRQANARLVDLRDPGSGQFGPPSDSLSTDLDYRVAQQIPRVGISRRAEKYFLDLGVQGIFSDLSNQDLLRSTGFSKAYSNLQVSFRGSYNFTRTRRLWLRLSSGDVNLPGVTQLQEAPDYSNPLNVRIGNRELAPETRTQANFSYNDFDWKERTGFNIFMGMDAIRDRIVPVTTTDANLRRVTTYTNVDGYLTFYGGLNWSKPVAQDSLNKLVVRLNPFVTYNKELGFTNGTLLESRRWSVAPRVELTYTRGEWLDVQPEYRLNLNRTRYNLDNIPEVDFLTHFAQLKTTVRWPEHVTWGNDIGYTFNGNIDPGFDRDFLLWNISLGVDVFREKFNMKVLAYDLLNQNNNVRRTVGADFVQDFRGTVLQRYFLLSLTWKVDQFGGKPPGRRSGGFRMIR